MTDLERAAAILQLQQLARDEHDLEVLDRELDCVIWDLELVSIDD